MQKRTGGYNFVHESCGISVKLSFYKVYCYQNDVPE